MLPGNLTHILGPVDGVQSEMRQCDPSPHLPAPHPFSRLPIRADQHIHGRAPSSGARTPRSSLFSPIHIRAGRASGASVVAIDNKIEQAMDLVKSHLMYAVREEVEVLKEQIKELYERNSVLERENAVLKSLANSEQLNQLSSQLTQGSSTSPPLQQQHPLVTNNNNNNAPLAHHEGSQSVPHQPNITSA
ncbi:hypothetical protein INR49_021442 [Caranx melampygus]|nr:hypothetical protein INR49_021442 [Caranx melampygus]